jgi:hypothetical protein
MRMTLSELYGLTKEDGMRKNIINLCPACSEQGERTYLESDGKKVFCSVHGSMTITGFNGKYFKKVAGDEWQTKEEP